MQASNSVTQIMQSARTQQELLAELEKFRRTVTVMFTDIKGSTSYFEKYGDVAGLMMVHQCNDMLRQIVEKHSGRVVKYIGDAIMAVFDDPKESISASIEMEQAMTPFNAPRPEADHVFIRIGLNFGSGIVKSNDVFGDVVNVASRVESVAAPEQIVISDTLNQQVAMSGAFKILHLGRYQLKGKEEERDLFEVVWTEKKSPQANVSHTVVLGGPKFHVVQPRFKLQHIRKDGSVGAEYALKDGRLTVGRQGCDANFAADPHLAAQHARFYLDRGQLMVEDTSQGTGIFIRLVATYTLQGGDIVMMGRQVFHFREKVEAVAAAAATGTTIVDMSAILNEPLAEFVRVQPDGSLDSDVRFPLNDQETGWGRNKGTYIFPDDGFMSRSHAKVYHRGENFFLEDTGSRNGTFVKVRGQAPLPLGATVLVGGQLLKVERA